MTRFGTLRPLELGQTPRPEEHMSAIASGTILRVAALQSLLPLPEELWLDYVDHWIFAQLHRRGLRSIVLSQVLQHDLSIISLAHLSPIRLDSVLRGEARFLCLLGPIARLVFPWRIAWRVLRLASVNPQLAFKAFRSILHRRPRCS